MKLSSGTASAWWFAGVWVSMFAAMPMGCGGADRTTTASASPSNASANETIANVVIENVGSKRRRHDLRIQGGERTIATELHSFVNPETPPAQAAGIKCWALSDPLPQGHRIRVLCRGEAEARPGAPAGLVTEGVLYCPTTSAKPNHLELHVTEQGVGEVNPDEQYLPVIRVQCRK